MIMDPCLAELATSMMGFRIDADYGCYQNLCNGLELGEPFLDHNFMDFPLPPPDPNSFTVPVVPTAPPSVVIPEEERPEDSDSFNEILNYLSQILMEDDMDDNTCILQESSALQAAEKPFYDILGKKYPPSPSPQPEPDQPPFYFDHEAESLDYHFANTFVFGNGNNSGSSGSSNALASSLISDPGLYNSTWTMAVPADYNFQYTSHSSLGSSNGVTSIVYGNGGCGFVEPLLNFSSESESAAQFRRGVEEASKFLPNGNKLILDPEKRGLLLPRSEPKEKPRLPVNMETKDERWYSHNGAKGRKHLHGEDPEFEGGRSNKQSAVYTEATERTELFDMVLLSNLGGKGKSTMSTLREALQNGANKNGQSNGKSRGKKQGNKTKVVDFEALLTQCAQAVAADDRTSAYELLKQIRQHSTPSGDANERLAHYFAESIEARLDGTGSERYVTMSSLRTSAVDILKAYHLYLTVCPFKRFSNFFSNRTILNVAEKATRLHIVDFGILYGFQWPSLIQTISSRPGGPPKLRITGIELPQRGFRPKARIEETGRRLADYARTFNVPFEYNAIAKKWEEIQLEDVKVDGDEVLVVSCLFRFRILLDETVVDDCPYSPRDAVLNLIKRMKPDVFIPGVLNGAYNAPFFVTRFREALFHFSAMFDMLDTNIPREFHERMLLEREIFAREAMNVISCEGKERLERPETFKQWQDRILRAGFKQLPLNPGIVKKIKDRVKSSYHKDFVINEDGHWLLQGWKGRRIYALSSWRPVYDS